MPKEEVKPSSASGRSHALPFDKADKADKVEKESVSFRDLPQISALPSRKLMDRAKVLLEEVDDNEFVVVGGERRKREDHVKKLKAELADIAENCGLDGFRYGGLCFTVREQDGKETLDIAKLIEVAGIKPEMLKQCTKVGEPFQVKTFRKIVI